MNRIEQMRGKISSLEAENERLREGLIEVMDYIEGRQDGPMTSEVDPDAIWRIARRALDGGGDEQS